MRQNDLPDPDSVSLILPAQPIKYFRLARCIILRGVMKADNLPGIFVFSARRKSAIQRYAALTVHPAIFLLTGKRIVVVTLARTSNRHVLTGGTTGD